MTDPGLGMRVAPAEALREGAAVKFEFEREGVKFEGFVIRAAGRTVAYENTCRHLPLSLDYGDGRFFTPDGRFLVCQTHGARYEPETGLCVQGPCEGARLRALASEVRDGWVWVTAPAVAK